MTSLSCKEKPDMFWVLLQKGKIYDSVLGDQAGFKVFHGFFFAPLNSSAPWITVRVAGHPLSDKAVRNLHQRGCTTQYYKEHSLSQNRLIWIKEDGMFSYFYSEKEVHWVILIF